MPKDDAERTLSFPLPSQIPQSSILAEPPQMPWQSSSRPEKHMPSQPRSLLNPLQTPQSSTTASCEGGKQVRGISKESLHGRVWKPARPIPPACA